MAMQAQHLAHAFHHDSLAIRPALDIPTNASAFLGYNGEPTGVHLLPLAAQRQQHQVGGNTVFSDPLSELTCNNNNNLQESVCFEPRKRARTGQLIMEGHRALLPVPVPPLPQAFASPEDTRSRVLCSVDTSTSGHLPISTPHASHGILSHLHRHTVELDAFVRIENERLRSGLEEARRRHVRAVVSAVERAAARRLRAAEADLERALARGAELGERLRQEGAEGEAWRGIATGHEAAAAGLRATLDQLSGAAEAEDARSCCFGPGHEEGDAGKRACRSCGAADACVLLLPCRHLCLCGGCEAAIEECPLCKAAKNATLHVLLS